MPRREEDPARTLVDLIRAVVAESIPEASQTTRVPMTLSGVVEDLDDDLDVVYIRMDTSGIGSDPTQTDNYEQPGVIPAQRLGQTHVGEQVRVDFQGPSGGQALHTGIESRITLPFGAEDGRRIILDGNEGFIVFFNEAGEQVAVFDSERWASGDLETPGERLTIDPVGGLRFRDEDDDLVTILDKNGYSLRNSATGQVSAEIRADGSARFIDPAGVDDIEIITSSLGTLPNPNYQVLTSVAPGSAFGFPGLNAFTFPHDDLSVAHVAGWHGATEQSATMTPPSGWTERSDESVAEGGVSLHSSVATRHPYGGDNPPFTSSQSNWQHQVGQHVLLRGGNGAAPAFRSVSNSNEQTSANTITVDMETPSGVVAGDVLVAFVSVGAIGGFVPTGWQTPDGWRFMGANFSTSGTGSSQTTLSAGAWVRLAQAGEPATHATAIQLPSGHKTIQATMVAISGAFLHPGGAQVRIAGRPIRRLLAYNELTSHSNQLCDFTGIPAGYDNLEVVMDAEATNVGAEWVRLSFNGDNGPRYYDLRVINGTAQAQRFAATNGVVIGRIPGSLGERSATSAHVYGYSSSPRPIVMATYFYAAGLTLHNGSTTGQWDALDPINRVTVWKTGSGTSFRSGSRAYLYGY